VKPSYYKLLLNLLFIIFSYNSLVAQEHRNSLEFTPQISLASFSAEQTKIVGPIVSGELAYHFNKVNNPTQWIKYLNVNSVDIAFTYQNTNNAKAFLNNIAHPIGNSYGVTSGLTFSLYNSKKSNLYLSAATGLAYFDKAGLVNENVVLGSKLNYSTKFQFRAERSISSSAWLSLVIAFYHLSNGGIRIPNKGLNVMSTGLGFKQYLITKPSNQISETVSAKLEKYNKLHSFDIGATIGATGMYAKNKFLHKVDLYAGYNYRLSNMLGLSIGADAIYNFTAYDVNRHYETYQGFASSTNNWRGGLGVGPDIWLGNFAVMAKIGYYLYIKPGEDHKPTYVYNTIGFKYHFVNSFALQTKVHLSKTEAEFVGFGIIFSK
jgi:hypothetical protein